MSQQYTVIATYTARTGEAERVASLLHGLAAASRDEPGNIAYSVSRDIERAEVFTIVEVYADDEAFAAHRASAHFESIAKEQIIPLLESRIVVGYEGDGKIA